MTATYTGIYERDANGIWAATVAEEARVRVQGRTLAQVRPAVREAIALWFHVEPTDFELIEDIRLPRGIKATVERARKQRERSQAAQESALASNQEAARLLVDVAHLSLRDAGNILGLSHQRIKQLLAQKPE